MDAERHGFLHFEGMHSLFLGIQPFYDSETKNLLESETWGHRG